MPTDLELIQRLKKVSRVKLKEVPLDRFEKESGNFYATAPNGNVTGVNLNRINLTPYTTFKIEPRSSSISTPHTTTIVAISNFTHLKKLRLHSANLTNISFLKGLKNLTDLDLSDNQITNISFLEGLSSLAYSDLRHNKIKELPEFFLQWAERGVKIDGESKYWKDNTIYLKDNPLEKPPMEIVRKGWDAVRDYFDAIKKEQTRPLKEIKVLLVGDGGAGKTSLVKRILNKGFDKNETQTDGIAIEKWITGDSNLLLDDVNDRNDIKVHLWDFGGQEIMHATHQFFLSKRSLYILVLDGRKDEKTEYWLKHIESFGGGSPVLVVLNKIDQNPAFEVNRKFLLDKYKNIKGFHRVSCENNEGIAFFCTALADSLNLMDMAATLWPQSWFYIKKHLENMTLHYISYQQYRDICEQYYLTDLSKQDTLLEYLNDLGVILHFERLDLQDLQVLEPKWVTEAVYKIINSGKVTRCKGILNLDALKAILKPIDEKDYKYPPETYRYIIGLMKNFELCYALDVEDKQVLIPDLLPVEEKEYPFDFETTLKFVIRYDFLPRSVMPRFIVRMHRDIKAELRWRTGVVIF